MDGRSAGMVGARTKEKKYELNERDRTMDSIIFRKSRAFAWMILRPSSSYPPLSENRITE